MVPAVNGVGGEQPVLLAVGVAAVVGVVAALMVVVAYFVIGVNQSIMSARQYIIKRVRCN